MLRDISLEVAPKEIFGFLGPNGAGKTTTIKALLGLIKPDGGKPWEGLQGLTTRVLTQLAADGRIVRGRPRGGWMSSQHTWTTMAAWLGADVEVLAPDAARAELARRWLHAFGPATVTDLRWWTGWSAGEVKRALTAVGPVEVDLDDGTTGLLLADDLAPVKAPKPWAALLPALDPTPMGWNGQAWYLGPHAGALFDRNGNVGPTVWWCGRIVGGWGQRPDGEVVVRLLEDVGADAAEAVDAEAARLAQLLDGIWVRPRFRTPLERELGATGA